MNSGRHSIIRITDFKEDPVDDTAFGITCDVLGPGKFVETVRVSFADNFLKEYFKIPWFKDFAKEEHRIVQTNRDLFVQWALVMIEAWIDKGAKEEDKKMIMLPEKDLKWAQKIGAGTHRPASESHGENEFIYYLE